MNYGSNNIDKLPSGLIAQLVEQCNAGQSSKGLNSVQTWTFSVLPATAYVDYVIIIAMIFLTFISNNQTV